MLALIVAMATVPASAQQSVLLVPDVPTTLGGQTFLPGDVVRSDGQFYTAELTLPEGLDLGSLHRMIGGDWLFSVEAPATLGGTTFEPRDVIRFDGVLYSVFFDGAAAGVPASARIDSLLLEGSDVGDLVFGFDTPTQLAGVVFEAADLIRFSDGVFSPYCLSSSK